MALIQVHTVCGTALKRIKDFRNKGQTKWLCITCKKTISPMEVGLAPAEEVVLPKEPTHSLITVYSESEANELLTYLEPFADLPELLNRILHYIRNGGN